MVFDVHTMFGRYNNVVFWTLLCGSYGLLPDYSKEYFTEDALDQSHDPERVKYLQNNYEHKPLFCRAGESSNSNNKNINVTHTYQALAGLPQEIDYQIPRFSRGIKLKFPGHSGPPTTLGNYRGW